MYLSKTFYLPQRDSSCPSLLVSCPIFDLPHAKENCRGPPDYLLLGNQRWSPAHFILKRQILYFASRRFCQKSGPQNFSSSSSKLTLSFVSNNAFEGEGAECSIACSDTASPAKEDTCFDCEGIVRELEQIKQICQGPTHPTAGLPSQPPTPQYVTCFIFWHITNCYLKKVFLIVHVLNYCPVTFGMCCLFVQNSRSPKPSGCQF